MKPPSQAAITKALGILLDSIKEENGMKFTSSCTHPSSVIPIDQLSVNAAALRLAKSCLDEGADKLISLIQGRRNMAAPIHQIPAEVFEMILKMTKCHRGAENIRTLLRLMRVCRRWHVIILSSPRLWGCLDSAMPPEVARMVTKRSQDLPILSLDWRTRALDWDESESERNDEEMLEIAVQNSARFRSMNIQIHPTDPFDISKLLESTTTVLLCLTVEVVPSEFIEAEFEEFVLSDGGPLEHLSLRDMPFKFDCPRLSRLVNLHLDGSAVPASLRTLIQVLSVASAHLEQLAIRDSERLEDDHQPSSSITFPRLTELEILNIMPLPSTKLVATIYAPACSRLRVREPLGGPYDDPAELDAVIWKPGNPRMAAFLGLSNEGEDRVSLISLSAGSYGAGIWVNEENHDDGRSFWYQRGQPSKFVNLMREFLLDLPSSFAISLKFLDYAFQHDPLDLIVWNGRLKALSLSDHAASRSALEQLGQRVGGPSWNETRTGDGWMCPNLLHIKLHIPEAEEERALHVTALLSLVRRRWSKADTGFAPATQPAEFEIICTPSSYTELLGVEAEARGIIPCFKFSKDERFIDGELPIAESP